MSTKKAAKKIKVFTPEKKAKMIAMLQHGHTVYHIAKRLDLTPSVARYHALKLFPAVKGYSKEIEISKAAADSADSKIADTIVGLIQDKKLLEALEVNRILREDFANLHSENIELSEFIKELRLKIKLLKELLTER